MNKNQKGIVCGKSVGAIPHPGQPFRSRFPAVASIMRGRTRPPCIKTGGPETAYLCRGGTGTHTGRNNERKDTRTPLHAQTCQEHLFQFKSSGIINRRAPRRRDVRRINTHTHIPRINS